MLRGPAGKLLKAGAFADSTDEIYLLGEAVIRLLRAAHHLVS